MVIPPMQEDAVAWINALLHMFDESPKIIDGQTDSVSKSLGEMPIASEPGDVNALFVITNTPTPSRLTFDNVEDEEIDKLISSPVAKSLNFNEHEIWSLANEYFPISVLNDDFLFKRNGAVIFGITPLSVAIGSHVSVRLDPDWPDTLFISTGAKHPSPDTFLSIKFRVPLTLFVHGLPSPLPEFKDLAIWPSVKARDAYNFTFISPAFRIDHRESNSKTGKA